jgi:uncharacterized membrane protein
VTSQLPLGYISAGIRDVADTGASVGYLNFELYPGVGSRHAIVTSAEGQLTVLTAIPGQLDLFSDARAISADGRMIVGLVSPTAATALSVLWTDGSPTWLRGLLEEDQFSGVNAYGISTDGQYVVGSASTRLPNSQSQRDHAALWHSPSTVINLAPETTFNSYATAVSDDGATVVGYMDVFVPALGYRSYVATIWTPSSGMVALADYLADIGIVVPPGIQLSVAQHISADGLTIAGMGDDIPNDSSVLSWVVKLPPPACFADFNTDGGIDGSDLEPFFAAWEHGETTADVNQDGGVDISDVQVFFTQWESGSCQR